MALSCVVCCVRVGVRPPGDATKKLNQLHLQLLQKSPAIVAAGRCSSEAKAPFLFQISWLIFLVGPVRLWK